MGSIDEVELRWDEMSLSIYEHIGRKGDSILWCGTIREIIYCQQQQQQQQNSAFKSLTFVSNGMVANPSSTKILKIFLPLRSRYGKNWYRPFRNSLSSSLLKSLNRIGRCKAYSPNNFKTNSKNSHILNAVLCISNNSHLKNLNRKSILFTYVFSNCWLYR